MEYAYQKHLIGRDVGVVLGAFCPLHQGHLDLIMRAKKENDAGCIVIVCGFDGDKGCPDMPLENRYKYVREFFKDDDLVAVYYINDDELGIAGKTNEWDIWLSQFNKIYNLVSSAHRHWYTGELEYKQELNKRKEDVILVDRSEHKISGTMIRSNPLKYWNKIANTFKRAFSHNILITGTASEGKSTLVQDIGKYFNIPYSYEWAREYMVDHCLSDWELKNTDFLAFLQGQHELNQSLVNSTANNGIFIADTDSLVTKMYSEYYTKDPTCGLSEEDYKVISIAADEYAKQSKWDKIFLLPPHGVFVDDTTRYMEHSSIESRRELYEILTLNLKRLGLWNKVMILNRDYYGNYLTVKKYIEGVYKNAEN